jgi:hypothetical protein
MIGSRVGYRAVRRGVIVTQQPQRPGAVALRPLGLADILDGSFRVMRRNPRAVLLPSAILAVVRVAVTAGLQLGGYRFLDTVELQLLGTFVIGTAIGTVLTGLLSLVVTQDVLGVQITAREALRRVRPLIWALIGLALVSTVLEAVGLLAVLVLGVWLWGLWAVAVPALVVEGTTIGGALSRSRHLVAGLWWRVWGIRVLGFLLAGLLGLVVTVPFLVLAGVVGDVSFLPSSGSGAPVGYVLITAAGSVLAATLTAPIRAGVDALLYLDLRMRREGLDIVMQQTRTLAPPAAGPARASSAF